MWLTLVKTERNWPMWKTTALSRLSAYSSVTIAALIAAGTANVLRAEEDFPRLVSRIPATANAICLIDAEGLRFSELGKKENWADKNEAAYVNSPFIVPPEANRVVVGSQLNPNRNLSQAWQVAVMNLIEPISMRAIARAEGGQLDDIEGVAAVSTSADAYFVELAEQVLGVMSPANRQLVARWATSSQQAIAKDGYLAGAAREIGGDAPIVLAIDLKNAVIPHLLSDALSNSEILKSSKDDQGQWENVIKSLQGIKLVITVTDKVEGKLVVDFGVDPSALGKNAKTAIIAALENHGAGLDSINSWLVSQSQNQIHLQGELAKSDLRKVMSILELPNSHFSSQLEAEPATENQTNVVAEASQKYFQSVSTLLRDLERDFKTNRDVRHNYAASYMQRYAQRIDALPILNVDDELINFGLRVSETLRDTSVVQGTSNLEAGVRKSGVYQSNNAYDYNNTYRSVSSMKTQIAREEQAVASTARFSNWKEIEDASASIRVQMTKKYGVEF